MSSVGYVGLNSEHLSIKNDRVVNNELGKDQFLELLITQMQYQDPLNPMDNQEMMAQMAQFTALEQMKNVADTANKQLAVGMVGQFIQYSSKNEDTGEIEQALGKVEYVTMSGNNVLLGVNGVEINITDVQQIVDNSNIQANQSAFELIGKTVQGVIETKVGEDGAKENIIIEGEVLKVSMKDETPYVVVGTGDKQVELALESVQSVVEKPSLTGKYITANIKNEDGEVVEVKGIVEYIAMRKDSTHLYVNGTFVKFEDIVSVENVQ